MLKRLKECFDLWELVLLIHYVCGLIHLVFPWTFFEKKFANIGIIDGSNKKVDVNNITIALENAGYSVKKIEDTGSVVYKTSKIIANKDTKNVNTICKLFSVDKYVISPSKTEGYDILIVIGEDF